MPLNLLAGATDHITPPAQVFALADHASTPADSITRHTSRGGHLGLFMSHEALAEHWPRVLSAVVRHSRASAPSSRGRPSLKRPRRKGVAMGDRTQRAEGKAEEVKGRVKRAAGAATGNRSTEAEGAGEQLKGKAKNAVGKARSEIKKATR